MVAGTITGWCLGMASLSSGLTLASSQTIHKPYTDFVILSERLAVIL